MSPNVLSLILSMLQAPPDNRPSVEAIISQVELLIWQANEAGNCQLEQGLLDELKNR